MKKLLMSAAVVVMIGAGATSCKKGHEDPGISFRGRDARVTGTWNLSSVTSEETMNETSVVTNDVNDEKWTTVTNYSASWSFDGSSWSGVENQTVLTSYDPDGDNPADSFSDRHPSSSSATTKDGSYSISNTFNVDEISLTLYKDHTYAVSYSYTLSGGKMEETYYDATDEKDVTESEDVLGGQKTVYSNSYEGEWRWNSKDEQEKKTEVIFESVSSTEGIGASGVDMGLGTLFEGHIIRLANKEIIIRRTENITDEDVTKVEKDADAGNGLCSSWDNTTGFCENEKSGIETTTTTSTTTIEWEEIWEKADDSESKRHKAEEDGGSDDE